MLIETAVSSLYLVYVSDQLGQGQLYPLSCITTSFISTQETIATGMPQFLKWNISRITCHVAF